MLGIPLALDKVVGPSTALEFLGIVLSQMREFTVPSQNEYDPTAHLSVEDIAVDSKSSPTVIQVNIKQSKTAPFVRVSNYTWGRPILTFAQ